MGKVSAKKKTSKKTLKKSSKKASKRTSKRKRTTVPQTQVQSLTYRPLQEADLPFLVTITLANMKTVFEKSVGLELSEENIRQQLKTSETYLIERGGVPIGYYSYIVYQPERMYWGALVFDAKAQGLGIGSQVVQHVYAEARARGVKIIEGHVQTANERAQQFWLKHGFTVAGQTVQGSIPIVKQL